MNDKQKRQKLYSRFYKQNDNNSEASLQRKLLRLWEEKHIEQHYQNIVLNYLDSITDKEKLKQQLGLECRLTYQNQNYYFKIRKLLMERDREVSELYHFVQQLEIYKRPEVKQEPNLERVCETIDRMRKLHLFITEEITEMLDYFKCSGSKRRYSQYYLKLFKIFDLDIQFLKTSLLKFYISFTSGYDPLFLYGLKNTKLQVQKGRLVFDSSIDDLFRINPSYLYRLLRAQQKMIEYVSEIDYLESIEPTDILHYRNKKISNNQDRELDDDIQLPKMIKREGVSKILNSKKQKIRDQQSNHPRTQENFVQPFYKRVKSIKSNYNDQAQINKKKDQVQQLKKLERSFSVKSINSKNKYVEAERTPKRSRNTNSKRSNHKSMHSIDQPEQKGIKQKRPTKFIVQNGKEDKIMSPKARNPEEKEIKIKIVVEDKRARYSPSYPREQIKLGNRNTTKSLSNNNTLEKDINNPRYITEVNPKNKQSLPSINVKNYSPPRQKLASASIFKIEKQADHSYNQTHVDCFCRKKYKAKKLKQQEFQNLDIQLQKKQVMKKIRQKYKRLAQHQQYYELSKLGHQIYHDIEANRLKKTAMKSRISKGRKNDQGNESQNLQKTQKQ